MSFSFVIALIARVVESATKSKKGIEKTLDTLKVRYELASLYARTRYQIPL